MQTAPPVPEPVPEPAPVPAPDPQPDSPLTATVTDHQVKVASVSGTTLRQAQAAAPGNPLDRLDVPQALAWIDANVTDLNSLRAVLKAVIALVIIQRADLQRIKSTPSLSSVKSVQK